VAISYRYHIGSFAVILLALLLGILIGIGLTARPEEFDQKIADLKRQYEDTVKAVTARQQEVESLQEELRQSELLTKEAVSAITYNRLSGKTIAIVLDHEFGHDPLPGNLRALLQQAGATLTSTTTVTRDFVTLPTSVRDRVAKRLLLYPPPGVHFRSLIAQALARELARGRDPLINDLVAGGLLRSGVDANYRTRVDAVLLVGGLQAASDAAVERVDVPLIEELTKSGVRVVGCEAHTAPVSCMPLYKAKAISTVDNADTPAGRLAVVLALAGAEGHFGAKETADRFLPPIPPAGGQ
jgi:cell division protein FtsB